MLIYNQAFKTIQIAVFFAAKETKDTRVYRFLLPKLLTSHTDRYPTRQAMNEALENLYGAYFKTRVERMGDLNVISITLTFVDPLIVDDPTLFQEALFLLDEVLNRNNGFQATLLEEEKRMLIEQWATHKNNKRMYAQHRFNQHFFQKDTYAAPLSGTPKEIRNVTLEKMVAFYRNLRSDNRIHVIVNGRVEPEQMTRIESVLFPDETQTLPIELTFRKARSHKVITETTTQLQQAILKMGYILPIYRNDDLFDAAVLVDLILGGYPESRLFQTIREKQGLCYDIGSNYDPYKGVLVISSGLNMDQKTMAHEAIMQLVDQLVVNGIKEAELKTAKAYYKSQVQSSLDQQSFLTKRAYTRMMFNQEDSIGERLNRIDRVTLNDLKVVLLKLQLDTSFILTGDTNA